MIIKKIRNSDLVIKYIDFFVLGATFSITCSILPDSVGGDVLLLTVLYSVILFASVRIGRHILSRGSSSLSAVLKLMLNNAVGLSIGAGIMLVLGLVIPGLGQFSAVIIIATIMAFFVLGTLSPLISFDRRVHQ